MFPWLIQENPTYNVFQKCSHPGLTEDIRSRVSVGTLLIVRYTLGRALLALPPHGFGHRFRVRRMPPE